MVELAFPGRVLASPAHPVSDPRHQALLEQAREGVRAAQAALAEGLPL